MKKPEFKLVKFMMCDCNIKVLKYNNSRPALQLIDSVDGEPVATASVNLSNIILGEDEICIKDYSENEGMLKALQDAEVVGHVERFVQSGYVTIPIVKIEANLSKVYNNILIEQ